MRLTITLLILLIHSLSTYAQKDSIQDVEEVTVRSFHKEIVFEDSRYYITDFSIGHSDEHYILLKKLGKYAIWTFDDHMNVVHRRPLDFKPERLFDDCMRNTHLVTKDSLFQLYCDEGGIHFSMRNEKTVALEKLQNCKAETSNKLILEERKNFDQTINYLGLDRHSGDQALFYTVEDSVRVSSAHDLFRIIRREGYSEHNRMGEINVKDLGIARDKLERVWLFEQLVTLPAYNPLFGVNDTLYVFNHVSGAVDVMNEQGTILESNAVDYHRSKQWGKQVLLDKNRTNFYAVSEKNGIQHLNRLSSTDYSIVRTSAITKHAHPKKVIIHDGYAYYTYRPNYDANLNKLYRQKL